MMNLLDAFLDQITMYRLVLYILLFLVGISVILGFFGLLSYHPLNILSSTILLIAICYITNKSFAYALKVPTNVESVYITALILALIITPLKSLQDIPFVLLTGVLAISSKYILAIKKKHIFNPAAIAVVITGFLFSRYASWWVGTGILLPFVVIGGFLVVRKIQRMTLVLSFLLVALGSAVLFGFFDKISFIPTIQSLFFESAVVFFATIMLTEPSTTPPTRNMQVLYGALVGFLFTPQIHVGPISSSPELALIMGNIFSYFVSSKQKLSLTLKEKIAIGLDEIDFIFTSSEKLRFLPGQYMEWTLQHKNTDTRGNRRYFSLASSPTEDTIRLGIKFNANGSSFKKALTHVSDRSTIVASQLEGEFTLPKDTKKKLVFVAGGIGITPFRSMIKYLLDMQEKRDIILLYSNKIVSEIMYRNIFDSASDCGIKTIYTLTDLEHIPKSWKGEIGRITKEMISKEIPDFKERFFYLSGPHTMVVGYEQTLKDIGIAQSNIKKDFFPGYA